METILLTANKLVLLHLFLFHALKPPFLIKNSKTDWKEKEKKIVFFLLAEPVKEGSRLLFFVISSDWIVCLVGRAHNCFF